MFNQRYVARFWSRVKVLGENSCWEWQGKTSKFHLYGNIKVEGKDMKPHRFSYTLKYGEIPDGLFVCHHCDNPPCVNPNHLFLGTNADNMRDRDKKGRTSRVSRNVGEKHGLSKLTDAQVVEIRKRWKDGESQRVLEREFGLKKRSLWPIVHGINYKHISL